MSFIPVSEAKTMIADYQRERPNLLKEEYPTDTLPICITMNAGEVLEMLSRGEVASLRAYFGMASGLITTVLVGVDSEGNDILDPTTPLVIDHGNRCPGKDCPTGGLNPE